MGFLQDAFSRATGQGSFGTFRDSLQQGFHGGSFGAAGQTAISALDPTIGQERTLNNVSEVGLGGGEVVSSSDMANQAFVANRVGQAITAWWGGTEAYGYASGASVEGGSLGAGGGGFWGGLGAGASSAWDALSSIPAYVSQAGDSLSSLFGGGGSTTNNGPIGVGGGNRQLSPADQQKQTENILIIGAVLVALIFLLKGK